MRKVGYLSKKNLGLTGPVPATKAEAAAPELRVVTG